MVANGQPYGDRQQDLAQERVAPMSQQDTVAPAPIPSGPAGPAAGPTAPAPGMNFGGPTTRPNEPITHGVDIGPGGGPEVLPPQQQPQFPSQGPMTQMLAKLSAQDQSGVLSQLYQSALTAGA